MKPRRGSKQAESTPQVTQPCLHLRTLSLSTSTLHLRTTTTTRTAMTRTLCLAGALLALCLSAHAFAAVPNDNGTYVDVQSIFPYDIASAAVSRDRKEGRKEAVQALLYAEETRERERRNERVKRD